MSGTLQRPKRESEASPAVPILPSRLRLPPLRDGLIERPRVIDRLVATRGSPLVAITAPAGFGKTTTLSQWAAIDDRPFGAVVLGEEHDDPGVLLTYVSYALDDITTIDPRVFGWLDSPSALQRRRVLTSLATSMFETKDAFVLVFDEAQVLRNDESLGVVTTLLDDLPEGAQLAIASRAEPSLPLAKLRADGLVADIGPEDLRLDESEVAEVMSLHGASISAADAQTLAERSEGWPVAVYLAAVALKAGGDLESFGGEDRGVHDYLRSEFLEDRHDDVVSFLRRSSVLHEMSGPLCDAVLETSGSASRLEEMEHSNLLLVPMDRDRHWYRYHHLLREALLAECGRAEPDAIRTVSQRASNWFESEGRIEEAVRYAQATDDVERVEGLVIRHGMRLFALGRDDVLGSWFDWLTARGSTDGAVAVMCGWLKLLIGGRAEADRCVSVAEADDPERILPDGSPLVAWTSTLRAALTAEPACMREEAARALERLSPRSQLWPTAVTTIGFADLLDGSVRSADQAFAEAVELAGPLGATGAGISSLGARAAIALEEGRWDDAETFVSAGTRMVDGANLGGYAGAALVHAVRARIAARATDLDGAQEAVQDAEELLPFLSPGALPLAILTRETLVRAYLELDDVVHAAKTLETLESVVSQGAAFDHAVVSIDRLRALVEQARSQARGGARLTPAELRIVPWLATQLSFREIGEQLFVSVHTVKAQVTSIYRKLGVASRTQAVEEARRMGLLSD